MSQTQAVARITCPSCNQPFNTVVNRILDAEVDPTAKTRLLSGQINVAVCPHCGAAGQINLPFLYHDPSKELALVFMPMEAGRNEEERQQVIGALSRQVMNQMPPEQRKSYLISPEVFLTLDSLIERVMEEEGITEEMIEAQRARADLLKDLLESPSDEERMGLIEEHEDLIDEELFQILYANISQLESMGEEEILGQFLALRDLLFEETAAGRRLEQRSEAIEALQEEPTRDKLVDLLAEAEDEATREALVSFGMPLVDYSFFQALTQRIESAEDEERERLSNLRREIMDIRERLQEQAQQVVEARRALLRDLLMTEEPKLLARRRMGEIDELFFNILSAEIEKAQREGRMERLSQLENIRGILLDLIRESMPPGLAFLERIMGAESDEEARQVLEENRQMVVPAFVELLEQVVEGMREEGEPEDAARVERALSIARTMVQPEEEQLATPSSGDSGLVTPSSEKSGPPSSEEGGLVTPS